MSARKWFTKENTSQLSASELDALNRAARMVLYGSSAKDLSRDDLLLLRKVFRSGKSAHDIQMAFWDERAATP